MPTTVLVNGKEVATPNAFTSVDASALEQPTIGSTGIVALLGMAVGGRPYSAITDPADPSAGLQRALSSAKVKTLYRSGDLRGVGQLMFKPGVDGDPAIKGGAAAVVFVKVNPAAASELTLVNVDGDSVNLTSKDYGQFTNQIKVTVAAGTNGGKKVTIVFEATTEIHDDLGIDGKATLTYSGGADGATTVTAANSGSVLTVAFTRTALGDNTNFTQPTPGDALEVVSASAGDTTQTITVFGLDATNVPQSQTVTLNGTTPVQLAATTWNLVTAIVASAACAGNVTLRKTAVGATVVVLVAAQTSDGRVLLDIPAKSGTLNIIADGATTKKLVFRGVKADGTSLAQAITLTGAVTVVVSGLFARFTSIELGNVEAARTVTLSGSMLTAAYANYTTLKQLIDYVTARHTDFTFTSVIPDPTEFDPLDLDVFTATTILDPTVKTLSAVAFDIVDDVNRTSVLVDAEKATNATGAPTNIGPVFLAGGHEGDALNPGVPTAVFADWQAGLDQLKHVYVNSVGVNTSNASIQAALGEHLAFMCGGGEQERDGAVGGASLETKAQIRTRSLALNTRHLSICVQDLPLIVDGVLDYRPPYYAAALVLAAQAGVAPGTPLTRKFFNIPGPPRQNSEWNPVEDSDELIKMGALLFRHDETRGTYCVRGNTTFLAKDILEYFERSSNQALNTSVYRIRTKVQAKVGAPGYKGTLNDIKGIIVRECDEEMKGTAPLLLAFKEPKLVQARDVVTATLGLSVVNPINFIMMPISLFPTEITA